MVHAQAHVCLCQCVPSTHDTGVTIPPLRMLHGQKGKQSSFIFVFLVWETQGRELSCRSHPCLLCFSPPCLPLPSLSPSGIRDLWRAYSPRLWACINNNASCRCEWPVLQYLSWWLAFCAPCWRTLAPSLWLMRQMWVCGSTEKAREHEI